MLDLRRVRVGVEVSGQIKWYEGLRVKASGTKYADPMQNDCTVTISGLSRETRDYLLTETSPFNNNRTPKRIILEVGRVSTGVFQLFIGDIVSSEPSSPPDLDLTIKAKTQNAQAGKIVSKAGPSSARLSDLSRQVAADLGLTLEFDAQDKNIGNYQHTGAALKQVDKLSAAGGVVAYIDNDRLVVKDALKPLTNRVRILNKDSGMVGVPKITEKGITVQFLIDPETTLGGALRIESKINPAINGDYVINQLKFEVASHDTPFFYTANGARL